MTTVGGYIKQIGRELLGDGDHGQLAQNRDSSLVTGDITSLYNTWLRAGNVWEAHFATESGTATVENNTAIDLTEPFYRMSAKSGRLIVPIQVKIASAVVWETGDEVVVGMSDTATYNTGGAAPDVRNLAVNNGSLSAIGNNDSGVVNAFDGDAVLTEDTVTNVRVLDNHHFLTGGLHLPYEYNILKGDPMGMLEGAGSFLVYVARTTTTNEVFYTVKWANLDAAELRAS